MLKVGEDEIICDLAETYHIFDFYGLAPLTVSTLIFGLRDDSRIKMKLAGLKYSLDTLLLAKISDSLSFLAWTKTKDAEHNQNQPKYIMPTLLETESKNDIATFDTAEEFEQMWKAIIG